MASPKKGEFSKAQYYEMLKDIVKCSGHAYTDKILAFLEQQSAAVAKKRETDLLFQKRQREAEGVLANLVLELLSYDRPQTAEQIATQAAELINQPVTAKSVSMILSPYIAEHVVEKRLNTWHDKVYYVLVPESGIVDERTWWNWST